MIVKNRKRLDSRLLSGLLIVIVLAVLLRLGCSLKEQKIARESDVAAVERADSIEQALREINRDFPDRQRDSVRSVPKTKKSKQRRQPQQRSFLDEELPAGGSGD